MKSIVIHRITTVMMTFTKILTAMVCWIGAIKGLLLMYVVTVFLNLQGLIRRIMVSG